jgi:hypothetical protein
MRHPRQISFVVSCAFLIAILSPVAYGCTIVFPTVTVGTTFRVRVTGQGRAIAGLRLVLRHASSGSPNLNDDGAVYSRTDANGYAQFRNLPLGSYVLGSERNGESADGTIVKVVASAAEGRTVRLRWPNDAPVRVRSMSGTLRVSDYYPQQTQAQFSLSLEEAISGRLIGASRSDTDGQFAFDISVQPGIYFLQLSDSSTKEHEGTITVEVDRDAQQLGMNLDLGWTSCGLNYSERRSYPDMNETKLCGDVSDDAGAVIANVDVWLLSNNEVPRVLEQTHTDEKGQFILQEQQEATYRLVVKRAGFFPFIRVVHLASPDASDRCTHPIRITLSVN